MIQYHPLFLLKKIKKTLDSYLGSYIIFADES